MNFFVLRSTHTLRRMKIFATLLALLVTIPALASEEVKWKPDASRVPPQ